jgi:Cu/Zn superoxide dismutase
MQLFFKRIFEEVPMRLVFVSGVVAFVFAVIGASLIVSGASAGPDDNKPKPKESGGSGAIYSKLGF